MTDWNAISVELAKPLDRKHVKPAKKFGPKGDYIEAWHAQAEANEIFGFGGWCQEVIETACVMQSEREIGKDKAPGWGVTYTAKVRITIGEKISEDFGAGHGYDRDLGLAHESAIKEAVSDAMKRALKPLGNRFGLALYDKTQSNVTTLDEAEFIQKGVAWLETAETTESLEKRLATLGREWRENRSDPFPHQIAARADELTAALNDAKDKAA